MKDEAYREALRRLSPELIGETVASGIDIRLFIEVGIDAGYEAAIAAERERPIDMILHCPSCGKQHVDAPEPDICECGHSQKEHHSDRYSQYCSEPIGWLDGQKRFCSCDRFVVGWLNPPHKSHLCHGCGTVWRPADVPTNGVEAIGTRGEKDTWPISGKGVI